MNLRDLINTCIHNLFRHKSRTILTVLGVIVGCCSVVIMISFGIAMKISQESMLAEMGDLRIINIYNHDGNTKVNDSVVESIEAMEHVIGVNPKLSLDNITTAIDTNDDNGRFKINYANAIGLKKEAIELFDYEIKEGRNISKSADPSVIEVLAGEYFAYSLMDTQRPEGSNTIDYWQYLYGDEGQIENPELPEPYVNVLNTTFRLTLGDSDPNSNDKIVTQKFKVVGILKEDYSKGFETSSGLIFSIDDIKKLTREYNSLNNIVAKETGYSETYVMVDEIDNVADVENSIKNRGFSTSSLESIREPMEKEVRQKQLMFAGLGVVSLFVAALGIMNTMIMAITERKREIGVMKALGCFVRDIKTMFLTEAGIIGLMGGIIGLVISLIISSVINIVSTETEIIDISTLCQVLFVNTDRVSVIPLWLGFSAVLFSILVGVASGYYPANKAIKVSALDAIRSE